MAAATSGVKTGDGAGGDNSGAAICGAGAENMADAVPFEAAILSYKTFWSADKYLSFFVFTLGCITCDTAPGIFSFID